MIAMTWIIDVPLTTDMGEIRAIATSTADALEQSAGLLAGITGISEAGVDEESRNSIGMLTIWANTSRMAEFLWGDATAQVERRLARPSARIWTVSSVQLDRPTFARVSHAGLFVRPRANNGPISALVDEQRTAAARSGAGRATGLACRALDPGSWEDASIDAWTGRPRSYDGRVLRIVKAVAGAPIAPPR